MIKRGFDIVFSVLGLLVLLPFLPVIALLIWLDDRGSVFFIQRRIGRHGFPFRMYKFRTMRADPKGRALTVGADDRITRIGKFLRKSKVDEFPQLWNVLLGSMSFVGPRPEIDRYVTKYSASERRVLDLKPGITDPASLALFDEAEVLAGASDPEEFYIRTLMPEKIRINLEYASKAGLLSDILVITATVLRPLGFNIDVFSWLSLQSIQLKAKV